MKNYPSIEACVDETLHHVGNKIVLAIPLGIGKPNQLVNEFYNRAKKDSRIHLTILTALSLNKPYWKSEIERRFKEPLVKRLFPDYPDLDYVHDLQQKAVPPNIDVREFYLTAGQFLHNPNVQRHYVSANYTHVVRDALTRGINVFAQMVGISPDGKTLSLSGNPDLTLDLIPLMRQAKSTQNKIAILAQVNEHLPFMTGDAEINPDFFDAVINQPRYYFQPYALPRPSLDEGRDYMIGFYTSLLVRDGGTLQLGIGSEGDAITYFLLQRHQNSKRYLKLVDELEVLAKYAPLIESTGGLQPFEQGLYGSTEMLVPGYLNLLKGGILKRKEAGALVHAGFFMGNALFYETLRQMNSEEKKQIQMTRISFVNELFGEEELKRQQRKFARFINTGMMVTLTGAVISDTLENHQVVSGVGGQYNFVAMAHALQNARSILLIRSTRQKGSKVSSNIVWERGSATIPRHLRDLIVTEYGIADLRGKSDEEVIASLLQICDSRFQEDLLTQAKRFGKISPHYVIPEPFRNNLPENIQATVHSLKKDGLCPLFPFDSDLTKEEVYLAKALRYLQALGKDSQLLWPMLRSAGLGLKPNSFHLNCLKRMQLDRPNTFKLWLTQKAILLALRASAKD